MLKTLRLQNVRSHEDSTLDLQPLTAFVGPNASGKTSAILVLEKLSRLLFEPKRDWSSGDVFQREELPSWCSAGTKSFAFGGAFCSEGTSGEATFSWSKGPDLWELTASVEWRRGAEVSQAYQRKGHIGHPNEGGKRWLTEEMETKPRLPFLLKGVAEFMKWPSFPNQEVPFLESGGKGLASVVAYLQTAEPEVFQEFQEAAIRIIPSLRRIRVKNAKIQLPFPIQDASHVFQREAFQEVMGHELWLDFQGAEKIPAHAVSDGTVVVLATLVMLFHPIQPSLLLIDEIEQGLHPNAQKALIEGLRSALKEKSDTQVIFTTHSPYLLDSLEPSEVCVFALKPSGRAAIRSLSKHPKASAYVSSILTTGEFVFAEGDAWVLGEEPA